MTVFAVAVAAVAGDVTFMSATDRPLNVDRPSKTDGPFSLDAGRLQIETEFLTLTRNDEAGVATNSVSAGTAYFRYGMTSNLEFQLGIQSYSRVRVSEAGLTNRTSGFGNTVVRAKYNLWGNDGGATCFTLLPFIKVPTCRSGLGNSSYEPGLSLPFAWNLPADWQLGLMAKGSSLRSATGRGHYASYEFSALASHGIVGPLSGYAELWTSRSTEPHSTRPSTFGLGTALTLSRTSQLDMSVNIALNHPADDLSFSTGYSTRF